MKLQAVLDAGGKCMDCGFDDLTRLEVFDFDHRDPSTKTAKTFQATQRVRTAEVQAELDKCDLVCANCHRTRTWPAESCEDLAFVGVTN